VVVSASDVAAGVAAASAASTVSAGAFGEGGGGAAAFVCFLFSSIRASIVGWSVSEKGVGAVPT